jgi:hypothetical protein
MLEKQMCTCDCSTTAVTALVGNMKEEVFRDGVWHQFFASNSPAAPLKKKKKSCCSPALSSHPSKPPTVGPKPLTRGGVVPGHAHGLGPDEECAPLGTLLPLRVCLSRCGRGES